MLQARVRKTEEVLEKLGPSAVMVPSSDHPDIMAGQATIATELLHQVTITGKSLAINLL